MEILNHLMTRQLFQFAGVMLLISVLSVDAQEATLQLPTTVVEEAPAAYHRHQANVAQSKKMHEMELAKAAREARIEKELKAAMAARGMAARPPVITTAEQFLAANKPPTPPPSERPEPRRGGDYVPAFEIPDDPVADAARRRAENAPGAEEAMIQSTQGGVELPQKKGGFFSKLFGRKKEESLPELPPVAPAEYPDAPDMAALPPETEAPQPPSNPFEIPDAPGINETPAPPSAPPAASAPTASIFKKGNGAAGASGASATVVSEVQADVSGVLVKLFKGDQVEVIERTGATARIRLKDGRVGTVAASTLR